MKKRVLSILLTLCMLFGMLPGAAFAASNDLPFTDVTASDWFSDAVKYVYEKGLMSGTGGTTFSPKVTTTRGMVVTILHRMEGTPKATPATFPDVAADTYCAAAVAWAAENGVVNGYDTGDFGPNDPITREQLAAILCRYITRKGCDAAVENDLSAFVDAEQTSGYALEAMKWAVGAGLINGVGNDTLAPGGSATRAQTAVILMRLCKLLDSQETSKPSGGSSFGGSGSSGGGSSSENVPTSGGTPDNDTVYHSSITKIEVSGTAVTATVSAEKDCTIEVLFLNEGTKEELFAVTADVKSEDETATIQLPKSLPEHFVVSAQLKDGNGKALNNPYTCIEYTTAYETFMEQTVNDFNDRIVLNFDASQNNNFAVLDSDVKEIATSSTVNTLTSQTDGVYTFTNIDDSLRSLSQGDKFYFLDNEGDYAVIKVASITVDGNTAIIAEDENVYLSDFYDIIKLDMRVQVQQPETEEPQTYDLRSVSGTRDISANALMVMSAAADDKESKEGDAGVELSSTVETPFGSIEGKGEAVIDIEVVYDAELFGEDHVVCNFTCELDLELDVTVGPSVNKEGSVTLFEFPVPLPATANVANVRLELGIPYKIDCEAGANFGVHSSLEAGFLYNSEDGYQGVQEKEIYGTELGLNGELEAEVGLELDVGLGAFGDFIEASVGAGAGMALEGEAKTGIAAPILDSDSWHACTTCIDGETYAYFRIPLKLSFEITEKLSGDILNLELVRIRWFLKKFYVSIKADTFPMDEATSGWGECPNEKYRVKFFTSNNSRPVTGSTVTVTDGYGGTVASGPSIFTAYLYPGLYTARSTVETNKAERTFTVEETPLNVDLSAYDAELSGTVIDNESNAPISGAKVTVTDPDTHDVVETAATGEDGKYALKVPGGTYNLSFMAEGYTSSDIKQQVVDGNTRANMSLKKIEHEGTLVVTVTDKESGASISGAKVTVRAVDGAEDEAYTDYTDENGGCSMTLEAGAYTVAVSAEKYVSFSVNTEVEENEETVVPVTLEKSTGVLTVSVTSDAKGSPVVSNATVQVYQGSTKVAGGTTDENGVWSMELDPGEYTVRVSAKGYGSDSGDVTLDADDETFDAQLKAPIASGQCGDKLYWVLSGDNVLTVYGEGKMYDYDNDKNKAPWTSYTIASVVVEKGAESIGDYAFWKPDSANEHALTTVELPDTLKSIGTYAFAYRKGLSSINLPNGLETIGESAFCHCTSLKTITVPASVTSWGKAFYNCTGLQNVKLTPGLASIDVNSFYSCNNMKTVYIPKSVEKIGSAAFWSCNSLTDIYFEGTMEEWNKLRYNVNSSNGFDNHYTAVTVHCAVDYDKYCAES